MTRNRSAGRPCRRLSTSSRRCSRATTRCASSRRRFSDRWFRSRPSRTTRRRCDRQRHALRPRRRYLEPGCEPALPFRPRHPGRPGLDQLLPCLSGARRLRRLQAIGCRPREPQDDAGSLPADQELAGQLQPEEARLLLISSVRPTALRAGCFNPRATTPSQISRTRHCFLRCRSNRSVVYSSQGGTVLHHVSTT